MEARQIRLGLIGYGEVGNGLGTGLRQQGLEQVAAFDLAAFEGPFSALNQERAQKAGVAIVRTPAELAACADYIIAVVPGGACVPAAEAIALHLTPHHRYLDLGSSTPEVKRRVGAALEGCGAAVADGGIMSSPLHDGHRILIKASGPAAETFRDALNPWGMRIDVVGATLGAATGIKILRSVVMKGLEALLHECMVGSARYGIGAEVLETISEFMDERPFAETAKFLLRSGVIHAERRGAEAAMAAEALTEVGVEPIMTRATAATLGAIAAMRLKERFGGVVPEDHQAAIDAVDRGFERRPG